jgi:hypothetical protein
VGIDELLGKRGCQKGRGDDDVFETLCKFMLRRLRNLGAEMLINNLPPAPPGQRNGRNEAREARETHSDDTGDNIAYPGVFEIVVVVKFVFECEFCEGTWHHLEVARHYAE